jgi:hypothetical protein
MRRRIPFSRKTSTSMPFATARSAATRNGDAWYPMCATVPPSSAWYRRRSKPSARHVVRDKAGANGAGAADNISLQDWSWVIDINLRGGAWREGIRAAAQGPRRRWLYRQHRLLVPAATAGGKGICVSPRCESCDNDLSGRDWGKRATSVTGKPRGKAGDHPDRATLRVTRHFQTAPDPIGLHQGFERKKLATSRCLSPPEQVASPLCHLFREEPSPGRSRPGSKETRHEG